VLSRLAGAQTQHSQQRKCPIEAPAGNGKIQQKGNQITSDLVWMDSMKNDPSQNSDSQSIDRLIQAAGGLVWRQGADGKELAIIHRRRYQDWSLPKGKLKTGESWRQAALREVREETGCEVLLGDFAGQIDYIVGGTPKRVLFWHMQTVAECQFHPNEEVDAIEWLSPSRALERLNYAGERALLSRWLADSQTS
jgi:8-oxo-dGTP diphosphatase